MKLIPWTLPRADIMCLKRHIQVGGVNKASFTFEILEVKEGGCLHCMKCSNQNLEESCAFIRQVTTSP